MSEQIQGIASQEEEEPDDLYSQFSEEELRDGFKILRFVLIGSDDAASWSPKDVYDAVGDEALPE